MAKFFEAPEKGATVITQVLAARNKEAHKLFSGLTVNEIARKLNLDMNDIEVVINEENQDLVSLSLMYKNAQYLIPFSTGLTEVFDDGELTLKVLRNCRLAISAASKRWTRDDPSGEGKYSKGDLMYDTNGNIITEDYLSLGKPAKPINVISTGTVNSNAAATTASGAQENQADEQEEPAQQEDKS